MIGSGRLAQMLERLNALEQSRPGGTDHLRRLFWLAAGSLSWSDGTRAECEQRAHDLSPIPTSWPIDFGELRKAGEP